MRLLHRHRQNARRSSHGHNLIELACVCLMLTIVTVLSVDIGVVMLAASTNERACRDAARAAAQANNAITSMQMATAAIRPHATNNAFITGPTIDPSSFVYQDYGGNPPPDTSPYVSVVTYVTVKVPAPVFFSGVTFNPSNGQMQMRKEWTFPIVKTQLYLP